MVTERRKSKETRRTREASAVHKGKDRRSKPAATTSETSSSRITPSQSSTSAPDAKLPKQQQQQQQARRATTLYDAVAGRLTINGFQPLTSAITSGQIGGGTYMHPLDPVRALMQIQYPPNITAARAADPRYVLTEAEQQELYDAWTSRLPSEGYADASCADASGQTPLELPTGELLEAVHAYTADYYGGAGADAGAMRLMQQNMDGTALFALGVLLEEVAREQLGEDGDLALVEGEDADMEPGRRWFNGVRTVPFVTEEEVNAAKSRKPEYDAAEGSLLKELLS